MFVRLAKSCVDLLYPFSCLCGGAVVGPGLCDRCERLTPRIDSPFCLICGTPFPSRAGNDHRCGRCIQQRPAFRRARACAAYDSIETQPRPLRDAIQRHKYGRHLWLARPFADLIKERAPKDAAYDIILPVPLHLERLRWRGFNQALLLARHLARHYDAPVEPLALERCQATRPQVELSASERQSNVRGAFGVRRPDAIRERRILLVDDVMTTGATVNECARVLCRHGATIVDVLVLARAVL